MTAPCAIEYILVTRWRGGKKGGQNRVCACDTRDRGVNKKLKPEHPSETVVMPESGERKRNLTTLVLVKNAAVKRSRSRQKVSELSQNPLSSSRRRGLGFLGFFPRPFGRLSSVLQITFTNPLAARLSSIDLLGRCLEAELSISL